MSIPNNIILSGSVYIKYVNLPEAPKLGDILLLLNDDAISRCPGNYYETQFSGYVKAKIFDGKFWQNIDISDFCSEGEHKISKKQRPIDVINLCLELIQLFKSTTLYRTYRGHFTINEYIPQIYNRGKLKTRK